MMMNEQSIFYRQSRFLVDILPYVAEESCFALKGGTAINFFFQALPRLSVDIDLTFLPLLSREETLQTILEAFKRISQRLQQKLPKVQIFMDDLAAIPKMVIGNENTRIKLEVSPIFRGSVFPCKVLKIHDKVENFFGKFVQMQVASFEDVYAGKFCATLSRQHPRDLFDVKKFFEQQLITDSIRQAFVVYLASDRRPMHELLMPNIKPHETQEQLFHRDFSGMIDVPIEYSELSNIAKKLSENICQQLTLNEKNFLLSISCGDPDWRLMPFKHLENLPSLQWKLINIQKMDSDKRNLAYSILKNILFSA